MNGVDGDDQSLGAWYQNRIVLFMPCRRKAQSAERQRRRRRLKALVITPMRRCTLSHAPSMLTMRHAHVSSPITSLWLQAGFQQTFAVMCATLGLTRRHAFRSFSISFTRNTKHIAMISTVAHALMPALHRIFSCSMFMLLCSVPTASCSGMGHFWQKELVCISSSSNY